MLAKKIKVGLFIFCVAPFAAIGWLGLMGFAAVVAIFMSIFK